MIWKLSIIDFIRLKMSKTKQKSKRPEYQDSLEKLLGVSISSQNSYPTSHISWINSTLGTYWDSK